MATGTKQRIVEHLQRVSAATVSELAQINNVTDAAMRQHLEQLEADGVVQRSAVGGTSGAARGRPASVWSLTQVAYRDFPGTFPNRHHDLAIDLLATIERTLGDDALDAVLLDRGDRQAAAYVEAIGTVRDVGQRVIRLAEVRDDEGYQAEATSHADGSFTLVEHHCAIGEAAKACTRLCDSELAVFRSVLGPTVEVEREQHSLSGDSRCVYRITPVR